MPVHDDTTQEVATALHKRSRLNLEAISRLSEIADYSFAFALRAVAAIGVADHLSDGPRHVDDLAEIAACDSRSLLRVLRALASKGVFAEEGAEVFSLTPMGDLLRTDHPLSMRWFFRLQPDVQALAGLEYSIRTGEPSFPHDTGMEYFDWLAEHEAERVKFAESQRALNRLEVLAISRTPLWRQIRSVVDIGGNNGALVTELLKRYPDISASVFDLPETAVTAQHTFAGAGVSDRASIVRGNILEGNVPEGCDVYVMKRILVGFSDEEVVIALSHVREAMSSQSRLLIMEPMGGTADQVGVSLDLLMLVLGLGRMRTPEEFGRLLVKAGLSFAGQTSLGLVTVVEGVLHGA